MCVPRLTYEQVREKANHVLSIYHPSLELPIPVEEIIDVAAGLHINFSPNLWNTYRQSGYLSFARQTIWIDETQYNLYEHKYRFTLAHEFGHYLLHADYYQQGEIHGIESLIKWRLQTSKKDLDWMDTHADWFAGCLLVPSQPLESICREVALKYREEFPAYVWLNDTFWDYATKDMMSTFDVSTVTIAKQIQKEGISDILRKQFATEK